MIRRILLYFLAVLLLTGCRKSGTLPGSSFRVALLKGPSAMSIVQLMHQGFSQNGIQADFVIYNEPEQVKALVLKLNTEIAMLPANIAAILYNKGAQNYSLVAIPVWGSLYLAGTDSSVKTIEDLRGKKIYLMAKGATPDIITRIILQGNHLDPVRDVNLDYTFSGHFELASAIASGRAKLGVIAEPFVSLATKRNPLVKVRIDLEKAWKDVFKDSIPIVQTAVLVRKDFLEGQPDLVRSFFVRYRESIEWLGEHPCSAGKLIAEYDIVPDEEVAKDALLACNIQFAYARDQKENIERYFRILFTFNPQVIGGKLPDADFYGKISEER